MLKENLETVLIDFGLSEKYTDRDEEHIESDDELPKLEVKNISIYSSVS